MKTLYRYLPLVLLAVFWEVAARLELVSSSALPPLSDVVVSWIDLIKTGELVGNTGASLYRAAMGLLLAIVIGTVLGIGMAWSKPINVLLSPIVEIFYPLPKSALIPVTVIWLGFGNGSKILLIFLGCMIPVTIGAFNGARSSEQTLVWSARSMGADRLRMLWDVVLPSALPELLNGIRTALALSFILLVSSELIVAREGLGYLIGFLGANGSYDAMYAVVLTVARTDAVTADHTLDAPTPSLAHTLLWGFARVFSIVALIVAWEGLARSGQFTPFVLPSLSSVIERIWTDAITGDLAINTGLTVYRAMVGFLISMVGGILIGAAMSRNVVANWFFDPIVSVGFPMPKIAFLPVVILWLGVYDVSKITIIVIDAIFPVIAATLIAIRGVERELIWSARNMGASDRELMWQIVLPAALPQILTGLQVALPLSMIVAVVAEMLMGGYGLGGAMMTASRFADSRGVFAGIVEIAIVGYVLIKAMAILRRRLLIWHQEANEPTGA
jgi:ABC-type nitrate/sulfonate/bicarbonate transport system permease component